ncbi:MAG: DUF554 domain-containing protein [Desulfatirhabdiaceae bacterium]
MLGTIVNTLAIAGGSLVGLMFRGRIPVAYHQTVLHAIGLAVMLIGIRSALKSPDILLIIFSVAIGSVVGEYIGIENRLEKLGNWLNTRVSKSENEFTRGFVTASLLYCVGSMAIVGSLESGLTNNHQTLYAKSILDGIASVIFASSLGWGVLFSALPVLIYQGVLTLSASVMKPLLTTAVVDQMSAVGGLLIMAIGINLLELKKIHVGNMLPAIFMPLIYYALKSAYLAL